MTKGNIIMVVQKRAAAQIEGERSRAREQLSVLGAEKDAAARRHAEFARTHDCSKMTVEQIVDAYRDERAVTEEVMPRTV